MNEEEKRLLQRVASQVEENNSILRGIRRHQRMGVVIRVLYWILIIGLSLGAFYFIQPYINMLKDFSSGSGVSNLLKGF